MKKIDLVGSKIVSLLFICQNSENYSVLLKEINWRTKYENFEEVS